MLFPGQTYRIVDADIITRDGNKEKASAFVVLIDIDGVGKDIRPIVKNLNNGEDFIVVNMESLIPTDEITCIYTISKDYTIYYSKDFGRHIRRFKGETQEAFDSAIDELIKSGYVDTKNLGMSSILDFKGSEKLFM